MVDHLADILLRPLIEHINDIDTTEICINMPGVVFVEKLGKWQKILLDEYDLTTLEELATACSNHPNQELNRQNPTISGALPNGLRFQVIIPPVTEFPSFAFRKANPTIFSLDQLIESDFFPSSISTTSASALANDNLKLLLSAGKFKDFFALAIKSRKNILISGATGSGKTTFAKTLTSLIDQTERLITIEDTREFELSHPNRLHLIYSKGGQGEANITAKDLLEASLRLRPDRVLMQELRDESAYFFLRNINTGHPGSVTTIHATTAKQALENLMLLIKQSQTGLTLDADTIREICNSGVDIVCHCVKAGGRFTLEEVHLTF